MFKLKEYKIKNLSSLVKIKLRVFHEMKNTTSISTLGRVPKLNGVGLALPSRVPDRRVHCRSSRGEGGVFQTFGQELVAASAAVCLGFGALSGAAVAGEFDILTEATPTTNYVLDDANVLSRNTRGALNKQLKTLEDDTGYRLEVATLRKLEFESDPFTFGDKVNMQFLNIVKSSLGD